MEIEPNAGLTGIAEAGSAGGPPASTAAVIEHELRPLLIGQDPLKIEYLWQLMFGRSRQHGRRGIVMHAIAVAFLAGLPFGLLDRGGAAHRAHRTGGSDCNGGVARSRRAERKVHKMLAGTRYIWLRNPANLSERQRATLDSLPLRHLKTARAYQIRLAFQELYEQPTTRDGAAFLKRWYFWATHSRLPPIIDAARTVKRHWDGILRWFDSRIANGLIEGINSLVQAAKAKARGYRSVRNLKAIVYLITGKLDLQLPA